MLREDLQAERELRLPAAAMRLLKGVSHFRDAGRWELMYRLAWRLLHENSRLLEDAADPDIRRAQRMCSAVKRECHKMHAFVRFRERKLQDGDTHYFAWIEPEHEVLRPSVPFFVKRFPNMKWTIATPDLTAAWDGTRVSFIEGPQPRTECRDGTEALWRTYYRSICNVARINPEMMQREMPKRYWRNLPETREITGLIRSGGELFARRHSETDAPPVPRAIQAALLNLPRAAADLQGCRRCDLWQRATQAVAGEGSATARIMLVGEQPGDVEDLRGRPFVGPAGELLDALMLRAGIERNSVYITNAVKHFSWEPRGKRRLHRRPLSSQVAACSGWLQREISRVRPRVIVGLGASAMHALTGLRGGIDLARGESEKHSSGAVIVATYHPSAILRAASSQAQKLTECFLADLSRARTLADAPKAPDDH